MDQITQLTLNGKSNLVKPLLEYMRKNIESFLSIDNARYVNFLKSNLAGFSKAIFDTNIYNPITHEWIFTLWNDLEGRIGNFFNKGCDYQERILSLLGQDKRIMITQGLYEEIRHAPASWNSELEEKKRGLDRRTLEYLRGEFEKYTSKMRLLCKFLSEDARIINEDDYDMNGHYDFKTFLSGILENCVDGFKKTIPKNDKRAVYTMIDLSLKEPTILITKDKHLYTLTEEVQKNISSLSSRLKKRNLVLTKQKYDNYLGTYVIRSFIVELTDKSLPRLTSNA